MKSTIKPLVSAVVFLTAISGFQLTQTAIAGKTPSAVAEGKKLAFGRKKGNCLTCHQIQGGTLTGNIGPALVAMKARFPDKSKLRAVIWDATARNPNTMMPPFGKHRILSDDEIDKITEYIYTL